jgi:hypothetical protein
LFEGTVSGSEPGHIIVRSAEAGCDLIVDELGRFGSGQRVWVALRPEKIRLSKEPVAGNRFNQIKGTVWELGYLGNRSTYRIKTETGKLVTVFAQNDQRTSEWSIDWSDEVYLSTMAPPPSSSRPITGGAAVSLSGRSTASMRRVQRISGSRCWARTQSRSASGLTSPR